MNKNSLRRRSSPLASNQISLPRRQAMSVCQGLSLNIFRCFVTKILFTPFRIAAQSKTFNTGNEEARY